MEEKKEKGKGKKTKGNGMSIRWKLILSILPVVLIALNAVVVAASSMSKNIILARTDTEMEATLGEYTNAINGKLDVIKAQTQALASSFAQNYKTMSPEQVKGSCIATAEANDMVLGSGVWFEPNVYDEEQKYYGPYWYKELDGDGKATGKILEEWGYSNAEYDYFSQEYYVNAKAASGAVITDPYYDPTSGIVMASCSAPILTKNGKFIGCVTADLMLTEFQDYLGEIEIGKTGSVWLIDSAGGYVYHPAVETAAADGMTIDESTEMGGWVAKIKKNASGSHGTFPWQGKTRILYWQSLPSMDWKMGLTIEEAEILDDINRMTRITIIMNAAAMAICAVLIIFQANGIAKAMGQVRVFAESLAGGDFTVNPLAISRKDEIGAMSEALNGMYENNSGVIKNIGEGSAKVSESSDSLSETSTDLMARFEEVRAAMERVNDAMMSTSAATQQVSASANEVNASVEKLSDETKTTKNEVVNIKEKARKIEEEGRISSEKAMEIARERGEELEKAVEEAKVVEEISTLAGSISNLAFQINLLSLNASIEAARAGEAGKGFAVVAGEVNRLASETKETVEKIEETIGRIQGAVGDLESSSSELLSFVRETVAPDYEKFITIGQEYGSDAQTFGNLADNISEMVSYISDSMEQVNAAVADIAESATSTAGSSAEVTDTIAEASDMMEKVNEMAVDQQQVAEGLDGIVKQFKL